MNHLAHALLGASDDDILLGGLIADFLRGAVDPALPHGVRIGIALHRAIDTYTDAHAEIVAARARFAPPYRRYAGILLDVWFDHLLARDWTRYAPGSLHAFSRSVQALLARREAELPPRMHAFARYLRARDLPEAYRDEAVIADVLRGLSMRLTRANPIADALPILRAQAAALDRHFGAFFPDLLTHAAQAQEQLAKTLPE